MSGLSNAVQKSSAYAAPVSVIAFAGSSILMLALNKSLVQDRSFNMHLLFMGIQTGVATLSLLLLKYTDFISVRPLNKFDLKYWLPVGFMMAVALYTASKALKYLTVPVYVLVKNLSLIFITFSEALFFGTGGITSLEALSFVMFIAGAASLCLGDYEQSIALMKKKLGSDISFSYLVNVGYFWIVGAVISSTLFVLLLRKMIQYTKFTDVDTILYNNFIACPILFAASYFLDNWESEFNVDNHFDSNVMAMMIITGFVSLALAYFSALCLSSTSTSSYAMVGAVNRIALCMTGLIFPNFPSNSYSYLGMATALVGGLLFALAKEIKQQKNQQKTKE
ncbi:hypothetical protein TPHA_0A05910 [Tetrapisispora phaffii CBS 4417]|uniref:GDP-mannose transporter n=1 Tax=Tetrapisispora phaffii (strain ATCC 24235 / CBS 4417 / NBRC 1672 / NRRL Y-8282 / UCD 70-5) TaxID=1071381 RepID=G8BP37_TETPH|nr:hypothetical protein TPHA_0A05910 [Tetrapisispora phaffii CBS 4417]CCE61665.1 hypothetical protein TPHA_0A05910 [Tetrapisispora phaffii CBS 4417]